MHFVELLSFFTCKNQVNWYITNDFVNSTPPDSLKKYVTPQVINIVYKWSTVVFFPCASQNHYKLDVVYNAK